MGQELFYAYSKELENQVPGFLEQEDGANEKENVTDKGLEEHKVDATYSCNPSTLRLKHKDQEFKTNLS